MIPSIVASRALHAARWHRSTRVLTRVDLRPQRSSLSTYSYSNSGYSYFASNLATTRHDNSNPIGSHQSNRMESTGGPSHDSPSEKNTDDTSPTLSSPSLRSDNSDTDKQDPIAGNNSTKPLRQRQDLPPRKYPPRNNESGRGPVHDFRQRRQAVASQQQDGGAARQRNDTNNYANQHRKNQGHERPRWRSKNTTDNRPKNNRPKTKTYQPEPKPELATSEWIKVSNIPPMSKLSDVFPSLNQIIDYEMQKGIIDLDALDNVGIDNVTSHALDAVGALNSLYPTQQISDGNSNIPLWTPPSSDSDDKDEVFSMILEARVHLSYRARPMGWFLRLPNRSVVHAILNHVRRAESEAWGKLNLSNEAKNVKFQRKQWREGLWKGVYDEFQRDANEEVSQIALEDESHDEKELMWGDGFGDEEEDDKSLEKSSSEEGVETVESLHAEEQQNGVDTEKQQNSVAVDDNEQQKDADAEKQQESVEDYIAKYTQSRPFPAQSSRSSATRTHEYQLVKSGSTALNIQEFTPYPSDSLPNSEHPPWEQHSFQLSPLLNLSDSVVRVETANLKSTEEDIQYYFRGYDLEAIFPEPEGTPSSFPSCYSDFPESIGWNVNMQGNIDFLVKGSYHPERQFANSPRDSRKERVPIGAKRHTFLVRFASSADARMAVRDKKGTPRDGQVLSVSQFPQLW